MSITCTNSTNYLSRSGASGGPGTGAFTIAAWMQWTNNGSFQQHLTLSENTFDELAGIEQSGGSGDLRFYINKGSTGQNFGIGVTVAQNTWTHVAVKWASNVLTAYVNGVNVGTTAAAITTPLSLNYLECGFSDSILSDICYYAAGLSDDEVAQLAAARSPKRRNNLFAYYPCWFGSRTVDYSGQGNTATENGTLTDPAISPPRPWAGNSPRRVYIANTALTIVPSGLTQVTGTAAVTAAAGLAPSGLTQVTGAAAMSSAAPLAAAGLTQCTGTANVGKTIAITATGLTQCSGASDLDGTMPAAGLTQVTGSAAMTSSAPLAAAGLTQVTGAATVAKGASIAAGGLTQTTGTANVGITYALAASGLTQVYGTAALSGGGGGGTRRGGDAGNPGARRHTAVYGTRRRMR